MAALICVDKQNSKLFCITNPNNLLNNVDQSSIDNYII